MQLTVLVQLKKIWKWASTPRKATKLDVVVVGLCLATAYYFVIARPARQREVVAQQSLAVEKVRMETLTRQVELDKCLSAAQLEADRLWSAACKGSGQGAKCTLPRRQNEELTEQAGRGRNACLLKHTLTN